MEKIQCLKSAGAAISVGFDSEVLFVTDFMNLNIKPAQSFECAHMVRVCVHIFI
jgi:hypothetical protein